jgi:hypothetical protein
MWSFIHAWELIKNITNQFQGVERLSQVLPNVRKYRLIDDYNHQDFFYAKNAKSNLYMEIFKLLQTNWNLESCWIKIV